MPPVFTFEKKDGKWTHAYNTELLAYMHMTHGVPVENTIIFLEKLTQEERLRGLIRSWRQYIANNKVNVHEIRSENEKNRKRLLPLFEANKKILIDAIKYA